jgi:hypothetical protein
MALKDLALYNPRASHKETGKEAEETSGKMIYGGEGQDGDGDVGDYLAELPTARRWPSSDQ